MNLCEWLHSLFLWFIFNSCSHHKIGAMLKKVVGLFTVGRGKRLYFAPVNKITFQPLTLTSPVMQAHANHERDRCKCMRSCFITQWTFGCIGRMDTFFPERHILLQTEGGNPRLTLPEWLCRMRTGCLFICKGCCCREGKGWCLLSPLR